MSEQEAIALAQQGDEAAFTVLYHLHHPSVASWCFRLLKNQEDAEDATQEVFTRLFQKIKTFRNDSKFSVWLYTFAKSTSLDMLRRRKRRIPRGCDVLIDSEESEGGGQQSKMVAAIEDRGIDQLNRLCLQEAYRAMTFEDQVCFEMNVVYGHSAEEICRRTGMMSERKVHVRRRLAQQQLQEAVV